MALIDLILNALDPTKQTTPPYVPGPAQSPSVFAGSPFPVNPNPRSIPQSAPTPRLEPVSVPERDIKMSDPQVQRILAMTQAPQLRSVSGGPTSGRGAVQQPGLLSRLGRGVIDYLSDPINRKQLAIGFNAMRFNPDANLAQSLQSQIETEQGMRLLRSQGNKTADALEKAGHKELAEIVRENPSLAKEAITVLTKTPDIPDGFLTAHFKAIAAGHAPGSEGYQRAMGAETSYGGLSEKQASGISDIRKEFMGVPQVKAFQDQVAAYGRIISSAEDPSAAGDLALIFNYMKLLDPGSVVRESEFRTAEQASAWIQRSEESGIAIPRPVQTAIQKLETGQMLLPAQRADFVDRSARLYGNAESSYIQNYENEYKRFLNPYLPQGADPYDYLPKVRYVGKSASDIATKKDAAPRPDLVFNSATGKLEPAQ